MKFEEKPQSTMEKEKPRIIPTIDIIRHGETDYKELQDENFKFNPESPDFSFDPEHLDLTEKGIENIKKTAEHLASTIDKENEAVILISSPQYRAMSSILIIEKILTENGITIINSSKAKAEGKSKGIKQSKIGLGQIPQAEESGSYEFLKTWIEAHKNYSKNHPEAANKPPAELHALVAESMGKELSEIFSKSHKEVAVDFSRFLRHAININHYLSEETKSILNNKKLRMICVTHEEKIAKFAQNSFNLDKTPAKGQRIELNPQNILKKGSEIEAQTIIYGKTDDEDHTEKINIKFTEDGLRIEQIDKN